MQCQEAFEALSAQLDGELGVRERHELRMHLGGCAGCRGRGDELAAADRLLRGRRASGVLPELLLARVRRTVEARARRVRAAGIAAAVVATMGAAAALALWLRRPEPVAYVSVAERPARAGEIVEAREEPLRVRFRTGGEVTLDPHGRLALPADGAPARLEAGTAVFDFTSVAHPVRVALPDGYLEARQARFAAIAASGTTITRVLEGEVRAEWPGGVAVAQEGETVRLGRGRPPALAPVPVPVPVAVPVAVPAAPPPAQALVAQAPPAAAPLPSPSGTVTGVVVARGEPQANAVAYIDDGDPAATNAPVDAVVVTVDRIEFQPALAVLGPMQRLELRSGDGRNHPVRVFGQGTRVLNVVDVPRGGSLVTLPDFGVYRLESLSGAPVAHAVRLRQPWFAVTGADGRFAIKDVPAGRHVLSAIVPGWRTPVVPAVVHPERTTEVRVSLERDTPPVPVAAAGACRLAEDLSSPVGQACASGGLKRARVAMKQLTKLAKAGGVKFECDDCHKDEAANDFALTDGARDRFRRLLVAARTTI